MNSIAIDLRASLMGSVALLAIACAAPAAAQVQEGQPAPQADTSATDADQAEIIITAQKREEAILDIPQSVSVVGGDTLERQQANTIQDFAALIPGLSLSETNPGNTRIVLRGVNTGGVSATVGVYVDETPFGSSSGLVNGAILAGDFDTFDIARLEVLRGPQGTLYGASSLGGVLKYVTNVPELGQFGGRARAGIETVDGGDLSWNLNGVVNAPLGDIAALRVSGYYRKSGGWIDARSDWASVGGEGSIGGKNINDGDIYGGRASLLVKPTEKLNVRLTAISQTLDINAQSRVEVDEQTQELVDDSYIQTVFVPEYRKTKYRVLNGTVDYDLGFASLLSSTSWARLRQNFLVDLTPTYGPVVSFLFGSPLGVQQDQFTGFRKFTQELRLTSPSSDRFEWMLGAYYTNEKGRIFQDINGVDLVTDGPAAGLPNLAVAELPSRYKEVAGFANGTIHFTDRFDLTAGARVSRNKQTASQVLDGVLVGGSTVFDDVDSSETVFTYSVAPRFDLSDTSSIYARVATGYRPGGPNVLPPGAPPEAATYDADRLTSYEVGLKTDLGRRLSFDVSAYVLKWTDVQLFASVDGVGFNANGGKATSKGLEAAVTWRPIRGLQLLGNAAYIDAQLDEDAVDAGGLDGDPLPWIPRTSFSLNADYEWPLSPNLDAFVGGGVRYVGKQYADFDIDYRNANGNQRKIDSYAVFDLRAGLDVANFRIEAFAQNLTNSHGLTSALLPIAIVFNTPALPNGALTAATVRPRSFGLSVQTQF